MKLSFYRIHDRAVMTDLAIPMVESYQVSNYLTQLTDNIQKSIMNGTTQ
jgi:hypothetical protein